MKLRNLLAVFGATACIAHAGVTVEDTGVAVRVTIDGALFTEYHYVNVARPYCYPVIGPSGAPMTRDWPMVKSTNEPTDHVHHKGLWFAHGDLNGIDFWSEQKAFGKTVHQKFLELTSGGEAGVIRSLNTWVGPTGTVVCTDERTLRFHADKEVRMIDYEVTLIASHGDVKLGDTKEGSMAIRLPATLSVSGTNGHGHIVTSAGARDGAAWGTRAKWADYSGPVKGQTVGVALFDSPKNPRHPTWWHVRTYGLFAANALGEHHFEKKPAGSGDLRLAAGQRVTFRYRFVFHTGNEKDSRLEERYEAYQSLAQKGRGAP
jgi:hypothetical protein